jgi:DNA-binding NarL/FixJ family response regulator
MDCINHVSEGLWPGRPQRTLPSALAPSLSEQPSNRARVAIVEGNDALREGWTKLLENSDTLQCACALPLSNEALAKVQRTFPDVVLVDIDSASAAGLACISQLRKLTPHAQVLALTSSIDPGQILQALRAGAVGHVFKSSTPDQLFAAISDVRQGGAPMAREVARKLVETFHKTTASVTCDTGLSGREAQVLDLLSHGLANKEIASRLNISFDTVRTHLKRVYEKLEVRSRTEAVGRYLQSR